LRLSPPAGGSGLVVTEDAVLEISPSSRHLLIFSGLMSPTRLRDILVAVDLTGDGTFWHFCPVGLLRKQFGGWNLFHHLQF